MKHMIILSCTAIVCALLVQVLLLSPVSKQEMKSILDREIERMEEAGSDVPDIRIEMSEDSMMHDINKGPWLKIMGLDDSVICAAADIQSNRIIISRDPFCSSMLMLPFVLAHELRHFSSQNMEMQPVEKEIDAIEYSCSRHFAGCVASGHFLVHA